ncbi:MAG: Thioredoxin-1 [candidate division BRC1 bacterium ADurb.BinA364]|nr:MAG: Thioredoxin-1 [candidate division BRC1 bacterium ADurb.BinA364]
MSENVKEITEDSFQSEVLSGSTPVLVDFWAPWCGPCKRIAPIVEELAAEYGGKVKFVKVDVDGNPGIAANFGIQSIPTLMLFKGGQAVDRIIGAVMKEKIKETIDKQL